ncbi:MAG: glutathione S-transferase N-terminal domain-containing protein, partial [Nitratireductor sp.]|nr:glutathione S-transferase N-terminal domain-containing protein [Nitratireductor sp.]
MTAELYCFGESGNAYKAALTMELAGYDWRPIHVDFFNGETRSPEFRAINEMGEVPVFREGGLTLTQSAVIQYHVAEKTGKFLGADRNEVMRWIMFDNHKLSGQAGSARFLQNFIPEEKRPQPVIDFMKARLKTTYRTLNDHLTGRHWVADDTFT